MPGRLASEQGADPAKPPSRAGDLPLQLPSPSPLPGRIRPEQAVPCAEPFDAPDWCFSVAWEGARALLFVSETGEVGIQAETLLDLTERFPEIAAGGADVLRRPAVLDGVVAVLDPSGKPDLGSLCLRLATGGSDRRSLPAVFLATDLLHLDGSSTFGWPLSRRLQALTGVVESSATIQVPDHVDERGGALAEAALSRGLTALLARRSSATYRAGVASPERLFIPLAPRATCVIAAVERGSRGVELVLAEHQAGRLMFSGRVSGPQDAHEARWLERLVAELSTDAPALELPVQRSERKWLRPRLCATVTHAGHDSSGLLQNPYLIGVRDDVDPSWCVRRVPVPPPRDDVSSRFNPTVLMPLPLDDAVMVPSRRR